MTIPAGYVQVNARFTGTAVPNGAQCTFGFSNPGDATLAEVADQFEISWNGNDMNDGYCETAVITTLLVKAGPDEDGPSGEFGVSMGGALVGAAAAPNTTTLIRRITASGGRKNRGRFYLPAPAESEITEGGVLSPTRVSAIQSAVDGFYAQMALGNLFGVILHSGPETPTVITATEVSGLVATQRRRLRP